jgi:DNA polymerase
MASLLFMDWETRSNSDLPVTGTLRYVLDPSTRPLLLSWAVDAGDLRLWCPDLSDELVPEVWAYVLGRMWCYGTGKARNGNGPPFKGVPAEIADLCARPDGYIVAFNCAFDRSVWQQIATPDYGFPRIEIEQTLDCMSQSQASNLPGSLEFAGRALGLGQKTVGGKAIMQRFARRQDPLPGSKADIENLMAKGLTREKAIAAAIEAWDLYLTYSVQDTALLRDVWNCTRPLDSAEWQEYWDSEHINDRGMPVDVDLARSAVLYREEEKEHVAQELARLTGGAITSPTLTKQINEWVFERLSDDLREVMVKARNEETGEVERLTGSKPVMTQLLEDIEASDAPPPDEVVEVLELLQFGRSSSAVKFEKIVNQEVDGRLTGSFVFNGAGQSGRASSRGPQVHNMVHDYMPNELDVLDMIAARVPIEELRYLPLGKEKQDKDRAKAGQTSVNTILSRSIRPSFVAPKGKTFVWGDWSAIEARVMPWLAKSRAAEQTVLEPYRNDQDLYILNAAAIFKVSVEEIEEGLRNKDPVYEGMRQAGKISQLSLQFGGSIGAYRVMARGYKVRVTNEETRVIVDGWRDRNFWAKAYWNKCDEAMRNAMNSPERMFPAGRLTFCFYPQLLGGALVTFLPCGRPLTYPKARFEKIERFGKMQETLTYLNGMGRSLTYGGKLGQNGCQAAAASILRATIRKLEADEREAEVIGHTHDEILNEVDTTRASGFAERLGRVMVEGFAWSEGLPLKADISTCYYYTKDKSALTH